MLSSLSVTQNVGVVETSSSGNIAACELNIYGQSEGSGKLIATGGKYGAGIGTGNEPGASILQTITIYGGTVTADGGKDGAGIGGDDGAGGNVTITGGTVLATAGMATAQAIDHGDDGSGDGSLQLYTTASVFFSRAMIPMRWRR